MAVHTSEDRNSLHRLKPDEAYEIGQRGNPVKAYLNPQMIVQAALDASANVTLATAG